ncbi:MAG TPA: hypothetical protein VGW78_05355 [Candidatus Babeliales bacterium]|nr:hypothetical protein [Candidatus Babeliales bacterium]
MYWLLYILGLVVCMGNYTIQSYEVIDLPIKENAKKRLNPTYYTPDGKQAVYLTKEERAQLDYVMRNLLDNEQEYNTRIDASLIKKLKAACRVDNTCLLIDKVLGDFNGKKVREMFLALGLRTNL